MQTRLKTLLGKLRGQLGLLYGDRLLRLVLFGSQARADGDDESDVDVLVVLQGDVSACQEIVRTEEIVASLSLEHDTVISCAFVSSDEYETGGSPLMLNVRREGLAV